MTGAGSLLRLIRDGEAVTRADLVRRTGLARSTVAQRLEVLLAHELVYEAGGSASTGGRPPTLLAVNQGAGARLLAHPPADAAGVQSGRRARPRRRPRRHALAPGRQRPRGRAARRGHLRHGHRTGARDGAPVGP